MASKRDLVEAHDFNRRRLVTAFLSGAPGGREVEPVRHGRTVIGGIVLALLLVAGAAVSGVLKPATNNDWRANGLVIGKDSGSRFMMIDKTLYPVANITSARLILDKLQINYVSDDLLVDVAKGPAIGIVNAPDFLPRASDLVQTAWVTCTNADGGLLTTVQDRPGVTASKDVLVVRSSTDESLWIVSGGRKYSVPRNATSTDIIRSLGLDGGTPFSASNAWLALIATGSPIAPFDVPGSGGRSDEATGDLSVVGTPVITNGQRYVLARDGLVPLGEFAYRLYRGSPAGSRIQEQQVEPNDLQGIPTRPEEVLSPTSWPDAVGDLSDDQTPCLELTRSDTAGTTSTAVLATAGDGDLVPADAEATVAVAQGRGAVVYATTRSTGAPTDTAYLIDPRGTRYAIVPRKFVAASLDRLGYGSTTPVPVPRAWVDLFSDGPDIGPYLSNQVVS